MLLVGLPPDRSSGARHPLDLWTFSAGPIVVCPAPQPPQSDFAKPELRALLDRGLDPLKCWIREDLAHAHPALGFHATTEWDNNVLACYLSHFLPKLPPGDNYWQQDVLVVHKPEHWQNGEYNRIYTQMSGNCLIPDDFHAFLLELTRAFGHRFIPVHDL